MGSALRSCFEFSKHLNTRLVKYSNGRFVFGCQMVQYSDGVLKTGLKTPVNGQKCLVFECSTKSCDYYLNTGHPYCSVFRFNPVFRWLLFVSNIQIWSYAAIFYGGLHRISPITFLQLKIQFFLQLKIQLEMARFEPGPSEYHSNALPTELSWMDYCKE